MSDPHWRLELAEHRAWGGWKWRWRLIHAHGLEPNGAPWMVADEGEEDMRQSAEEAARSAWLRITGAVVPGERIDWQPDGVHRAD